MSLTLFQLSAEMTALEDMLLESGGELTPELEAALTETQQGLSNKIDGYCAILHKFDYTEDVLDAEIKRLTARKKTVANAKDRLKKHVCDTMGAFGMTKLESNLNTMTRRRSTKVETNDEVILAPYLQGLEEYRKTLPIHIQVPDLKVSKSAIKDIQKDQGILVNGAEIVENWSLIIK